MIMNLEEVIIWKEVIVGYLKLLPRTARLEETLLRLPNINIDRYK
jgi:hypothetical protein